MAQIATDQCPPDCEEIIALLSPYIDGELRGGDKERVESHLEGCTFCMAALEEMREASRSFRMFIPVVPPADVAQAFNRQLDEITSQGAGDGQGDSQGHGDDSLDSVQSQTRDGDIENATQVMPQGRGGGSGFARLLRRRAPWIAAGAIVLLLATAGILAWGAGHDDEPGAQTIPAAGTDTATTGTGSRTQTTISPTPAVSDPTPQVETTPTTSAVTTATTPAAGGSTDTPARVTSGYASPNRVSEGQTVAYVSVIQGAAASVTVDLAPQTGGSSISISLKRTSTGSGTETWSASQVAGASGTYYIYVSAIDAQGQYDSLYVGNLTVSPTIY